MARRSLFGCRTIVTGASSGIGNALVRQLAAAGSQVVATARRESELSRLAEEIHATGKEILVVPGDITEPAVRHRVLECAVKNFGGLDLLVNNAGIGAIGNFAEAGEERLRQIMEVNFFALAEMTREALPFLLVGRSPMICNIDSVLGYRGVPRSSEYCASKFAVRGLSESLRSELAAKGIDVLVVSPSTTQTQFFDRLIEKKGTTSWENRPRMSADRVAQLTARAISRGKKEVVLSAGGKLLVWASRSVPGILDWIVTRYF